jgi:glycosyltransferase involved in cell wall biosynthesis
MGADVLVETQVHGVPSGARAARRAGIPLVLDDVSPPGEERVLGGGLPGLAERAFRRESAVARALVVSSEGLRRDLAAEGVPEERLAVVPNGVDLAAHQGRDRRAARRSLGVEGRLVVGYAGSFQPWHRVEMLVVAVAELAEAHAVHLLLVGDGPGREEALAAAERAGLAGRVTAPGRVPPERVPGLLAACDVGALPGTNDYGQPMKLLEYAAAGLAVVAPDRPPVREVVTAGRTALLFPPGDGHALAAALRRLSADPGLREDLGQRARREVAGPAGWSVRAEELAAVLRAVGDPADRGRAP